MPFGPLAKLLGVIVWRDTSRYMLADQRPELGFTNSPVFFLPCTRFSTSNKIQTIANLR